MKKEYWVTAALANDAMVADFLIRIKHSSSHSPTAISLTPFRWGHRKSRSKPSAFTNSAAGCAFRKELQSGSPTTPLCWSGGGGASTSDAYDESSRPSDLSSAGRSTKGGVLGNEGATTSSYKKSRKRKSFAELKEEEDFLLKERLHLDRELQSMRANMSKQIAASQNLKKFKIDLHQQVIEKRANALNNKPQLQTKMIFKVPSYEVEPEIEARESGFVLPDLNMIPDEEQP